MSKKIFTLNDVVDMLLALKMGVIQIQCGVDELLPVIAKLEELIKKGVKDDK